MKSEPERKLSTGQVAQMFGVNTKTANRWIHEGKFPRAHRTPGGQYRVPILDVLAYMDQEPAQ